LFSSGIKANNQIKFRPPAIFFILDSKSSHNPIIIPNFSPDSNPILQAFSDVIQIAARGSAYG